MSLNPLTSVIITFKVNQTKDQIVFQGIGQKIKSAIYDDVEVAPAIPAPQAQQLPQPAANQPPADPSKIDSMVVGIKEAIYGRDTAYTQLMNAAKSLADVIPDQSMCLKAAHKTTNQGRTGKDIAAVVDVHLQDVDGEEQRFKHFVEEKHAAEAAEIKAKIEASHQVVKSGEAELVQLQQRITELNASIEKNKQNIASAEAAVVQIGAYLNSSLEQFKAAAQIVRLELNNSRATILTTLV